MTKTTISLAVVPYNGPEARPLTQALHAEQIATYGFAEDPDDTPADHFNPPNGVFVIARLRGRQAAVGCGGCRLIAPDTAEIKRMYVHPDARGLSLGSRILELLEQEARTLGAARILLETGNRNAAALSLYEKFNYRPIPPYVPGRQPSVNRAMAKTLTRASGASRTGAESAALQSSR
ncbi:MULTISPECIES: GNAT family N-acetyltransferase [unclassified Kitasatospora]|uniref:GNAT family N-acetyltransferase n=1 Tax=unclassified Kitasatospora TaxID=2633591 RepID=UPI0007C6420E|nr:MULTISPECIES: GNAT family N-acetyltransferase [unclassified Kitasatospora]